MFVNRWITCNENLSTGMQSFNLILQIYESYYKFYSMSIYIERCISRQSNTIPERNSEVIFFCVHRYINVIWAVWITFVQLIWQLNQALAGIPVCLKSGMYNLSITKQYKNITIKGSGKGLVNAVLGSVFVSISVYIFFLVTTLIN